MSGKCSGNEKRRRVVDEEDEEEAEEDKEEEEGERRRWIVEYLPRTATLNNSRARFPRRRANMNRRQAFVASLDFHLDAKMEKRRDAARNGELHVRSIVATFTVASSWRRKILDVPT